LCDVVSGKKETKKEKKKERNETKRNEMKVEDLNPKSFSSSFLSFKR